MVLFASIFSLGKLSLPLMGSHSGEDVTRGPIRVQVGIAVHSRRELSCRALGVMSSGDNISGRGLPCLCSRTF